MAKPIEIKTKIVGVRYNDPANPSLNRQEVIRKLVKAGQRLELRPEPENPVDPGAVAVWLRKRVLLATVEYHLGYLNSRLAHDVGVMWEQGRRPTCTVLAVTGGESGKVSYGVNVVIKG